MITKEVARLVFNCYSEIENGEKMLEELKESVNENGEFELKDDWGNVRGLELRIPLKNSSSGCSIRRVPFEVGIQTILTHIENQKKELERLKTVCKTQIL